MLPTRITRVAVVVLAVIAVACGDPTRAKATYANALQSYALYALTGAPPTAPNAISFLSGATRANASFTFDLAFDIDAAGKPVVYPVRSLAGAMAGVPKRVGLQVISGTFDAIREVPETGYDTVSSRTITPGSVLAVELRDPSACFSYSFLQSQLLYAKLVVDSVNVTTHRLYVRAVFDPNCGYRMVVPDSVPTN